MTMGLMSAVVRASTGRPRSALQSIRRLFVQSSRLEVRPRKSGFRQTSSKQQRRGRDVVFAQHRNGLLARRTPSSSVALANSFPLPWSASPAVKLGRIYWLFGGSEASRPGLCFALTRGTQWLSARAQERPEGWSGLAPFPVSVEARIVRGLLKTEGPPAAIGGVGRAAVAVAIGVALLPKGCPLAPHH